MEEWNDRRINYLTPDQLSKVIEINTVEGVKNSSNKLRMKRCFTEAGVRTADWWIAEADIRNGVRFQGNGRTSNTNINQLPYPIIAKSLYGSRGEGNTKLNNQRELEQWMKGKIINNYIFEKFYSYTREYRLHVTCNGCFYTCRKMLKRDAPEANKWQRHDDNCVWILEENPAFDKPVNWNTIVEDCQRALNALGLDIAGFDVKVQSATTGRGKKRENPEYIIIESNSACSFGRVTGEKYVNELNKLIDQKIQKAI